MEAGACPISDLFDVRQGVRTGMNGVFLLDKEKLTSLPVRERKFFRPAVMNESIQDGQIREGIYIFYPYDLEGPTINTERELLDRVPTFAKRVLLPARERLARRANILEANRSDWWGLSRRRGWALDQGPKIISKYFGGPGGFATDLDSKFIIVQGFAWFPRWKGDDEDEISSLPKADLICAYSGLMNSGSFGRLLEMFSPHVAGGQFDLSPRYVNQIPIPNMSDLSRDERAGRLITRLAVLGREPRLGDPEWSVSVDRIASELYGGFFELV
jgi:adenine-specific DNA-methyltransferase